jgi:hypothetical protein
MQLEQLQEQWQRLDEKLERTVRVQSDLLRLAVMRPARRRIHWMAFWPAFDLACCVVAVIVTGFFLRQHWAAWSLVVPAGIVLAAAVALLIDSMWQLERISRIDWGGTVVDIQQSLSRLRIATIRQFKWVILLCPLVGFCGLVVGSQSLLDRLPQPHFILDKLNPWWAASNYAFGVLFILFGYAIIRFLAKRFGNRGWWQRALDAVSGTAMTQARNELERWSQLGDRVATSL